MCTAKPRREDHGAEQVGRAVKAGFGAVRRPAQKLRELAAPYLAISIGGALGANARYLVSDWGTALWGAGFPYATLLENVTGSFLLGLYLALVSERFAGRVTTRLLVATGFLGSYTTLSTFSVETVQLLEAGLVELALAYVGASVLLSLVAVGLGIAVAHAL